MASLEAHQGLPWCTVPQTRDQGGRAWSGQASARCEGPAASGGLAWAELRVCLQFRAELGQEEEEQQLPPP